MPSDTAARLLNAYELGTKQMSDFFEQRMNTNDVMFWDSIPQLKIDTFAGMTRKKNIKGENEKVITVSADRDLLSRLVIIAKARDVNLMGSLALSFLLFPLLSHIQMVACECKECLTERVEEESGRVSNITVVNLSSTNCLYYWRNGTSPSS